MARACSHAGLQSRGMPDAAPRRLGSGLLAPGKVSACVCRILAGRVVARRRHHASGVVVPLHRAARWLVAGLTHTGRRVGLARRFEAVEFDLHEVVPRGASSSRRPSASNRLLTSRVAILKNSAARWAPLHLSFAKAGLHPMVSRLHALLVVQEIFRPPLS